MVAELVLDPATGPWARRSEAIVLHFVPEWLRPARADGGRLAGRRCRDTESSHHSRRVVSARVWSASAELASATAEDRPASGKRFFLERGTGSVFQGVQ